MTRLVLLLLLPLLAACGAGNPLTGDTIDRPGTWQPTGDNDANLRVMVANPRDLAAGVGAANSAANAAAPPVGLLLSGKRAALLSESTGTASALPQGGSNAGSQ